jgi:archaellum biogenesis ATPase FlaH
MSFEKTIFGNLINREEYGRKVIPFLKKEYFQDPGDRILFDIIETYVLKYNRFPTKESLGVDIENLSGIDSDRHESLIETVELLNSDPNTDLDFIVGKTEAFCQERAVYNAIMQSIQIIDNKDRNQTKGSIPQILTDALSISFDTNIGHNWMDDAESRYEFYHRKESRVPFNLEYFNVITKGGLPNKTLNIILGGTGAGKTLFMCHCAAGNLLDSKNVLYITMEMAEERIAERIDANLLDITIDDLNVLSKDSYEKKIAKIRSKTTGKLIIKEYPTASAGSANFRHLLNELKLKKNFIPDIIYIDYLNICASSRMKYTSNVNTYMYVKAIAEELRGLAVECNVPIVSATQMTRSGFGNSDPGLEDTSESFGLPATADFMFALITSEELDGLGQLMVKQLKNRYNDISNNKRFVIGVDRTKMKLFDVENGAQDGVMDDKPVMDNTGFGERDSDFFKKRSKFGKSIEGFK